MSDDYEIIARGAYAERLLTDEQFIQFVADTTQALMAEALATEPSEYAQREGLYAQAKGLQRVLVTMHEHVAIAERLRDGLGLNATDDYNESEQDLSNDY